MRDIFLFLSFSYLRTSFSLFRSGAICFLFSFIVLLFVRFGFFLFLHGNGGLYVRAFLQFLYRTIPDNADGCVTVASASSGTSARHQHNNGGSGNSGNNSFAAALRHLATTTTTTTQQATAAAAGPKPLRSSASSNHSDDPGEFPVSNRR